MIDRRSFLWILAGTAAGVVLDPELALWVPGAKKIFLPSAAQIAIVEMPLDMVSLDGILKKYYQGYFFDAVHDTPLMFIDIIRTPTHG